MNKTQIVIIAHAPLASTLKSCSQHVYAFDKNTTEHIKAFDVLPDADTEAVLASVLSAIGAQEDRSPVLVLTDIAGATPANIATELLKFNGIEVITGVNLAMVLTALCHREDSFEDIKNEVLLAAHASIGTIEAKND